MHDFVVEVMSLRKLELLRLREVVLRPCEVALFEELVALCLQLLRHHAI